MGTQTSVVTKTEAANADLIRLDNKKYGPLISSLVDAKAVKKDADATSRSADKDLKNAQGQLLSAISPARAAVCGNRVLTVKAGRQEAAKITLKNGRTIAWEDVTFVLVGKERIDPADISTLFGGRTISDSIEVV